MVELMIVVLIVGILVAVALPTFLGSRQRAQDSAAKASLRTAVGTGRTNLSDDGDYTGLTLSLLQSTEPSLEWVPGATESTDTTIVSARVAAGGALELAAFASGNCFFLRDDPPGGTTYGQLAGVDSSECYAANSGAVTFTDSW
jgi:type IV pilus assembly protein PilA